jgi:hypothetical protein
VDKALGTVSQRRLDHVARTVNVRESLLGFVTPPERRVPGHMEYGVNVIGHRREHGRRVRCIGHRETRPSRSKISQVRRRAMNGNDVPSASSQLTHQIHAHESGSTGHECCWQFCIPPDLCAQTGLAPPGAASYHATGTVLRLRDYFSRNFGRVVKPLKLLANPFFCRRKKRKAFDYVCTGK